VFVSAASSFHPVGANFTFCDGSVRFIKETIQQSPINPTTSFSQNVTVSAGNLYAFNAPPSVYQALSTRIGGEVISSDAY
jgi:prepilin-type processing-associated H-X9-DG protein